MIGFLDADDACTPTALERLVGVLDETGSDFAAGAYVRLRPDGDGGYTPGVVQPWVAAATAPERRAVTIDQHPEASGNIVAWSKVSRLEFWRRTGLRFPVGRLYEDQVVAQRMYASARSFDVIPDVVVQWRERADGSSITQRKDAVPVLRDYLEGMSGGIAELDARGTPRRRAGARAAHPRDGSPAPRADRPGSPRRRLSPRARRVHPRAVLAQRPRRRGAGRGGLPRGRSPPLVRVGPATAGGVRSMQGR